MNYADYLLTSHWKVTRQEALNNAGNRCQMCASNIRLEVHHNNYTNLWKESTADLIVLCHDCHELFHGVQPTVIYIPEPPVNAVERTRRDVTESEFDEIKKLWLRENAVILGNAAGRISDTDHADLISEIREEIAAIMYEAQ